MLARTRQGLTLTEVVVLIAISCIVAALFFPTVRRGRGTARRSQCKNNLKQIGLALHNYEEIFRTLPPGIINAPAFPNAKTGTNMLSWNQMILAQFDQGPLGKKFDSNVSILGAPNLGLSSTILPTFRCPSDLGPEQADNVGSRGARRARIDSQATSNYPGCFGVGIPTGDFRSDSSCLWRHKREHICFHHWNHKLACKERHRCCP